jgi:EmrB/QacA subfamily drug resistance transporter
MIETAPKPFGHSVDRVPWLPIAVVLVGMFMAILDAFIVVVAGPDIRADLGASDGELQWVLASYQMAYAVFTVTGGRLGDLCGRKRIFLVGASLFTLSSAACAMAPTPTWLIAARVPQGLGAALMVPQVFSVITLLVAQDQKPKVFGVLGFVIGAASVGGQVIGGALIAADLFGSAWRPVFWVNIPIGLTMIALALRYLPESRAASAAKLDVPGVLSLSAALGLLLASLIQGRALGWPWWIWFGLAASAGAAWVFVSVERRITERGGDPLVHLGLFKQKAFAVGIVLVLCVYADLTSYYLALSVSMQAGLGLSAFASGLVYAPAAATFFICSLLAGRLVPRHGRRVLEVGAVLMATGYLTTGVVLVSGLGLSPEVVIPTLVLQSVGGGLLITPLLGVVLSGIHGDDPGAASGALATAQQIGGALGVAIIGAVFFHVFRTSTVGPAEAARHAFAAASFGTFALASIATALVFRLPSSRP